MKKGYDAALGSRHRECLVGGCDYSPPGVTARGEDGHVPANMLHGNQADESRRAAKRDGQWAVFTLEGDYVVDYVNACIYRGDSSIQQLEVP